MIMYHQAKFCIKRISSLEDIVDTVIFGHKSLCCDFDLEKSKKIFLRDTPAHDNVSQYPVW